MVDTPAKSADLVTVGMLAQRLDGMDEAIKIVREAVSSMPSPALVQADANALKELVLAERNGLKELFLEKFAGISTQFAERDKRTEQLSIADKTAIAAALQAQKEAAAAQNDSNATANTKMETNFAKLIEQGQALLLEVKKNLEGQVADLKSRQDKGEGQTRGTGDATASSRALLFSVIGIVVAIIVGGGGLVFGVVAMLRGGA